MPMPSDSIISSIVSALYLHPGYIVLLAVAFLCTIILINIINNKVLMGAVAKAVLTKHETMEALEKAVQGLLKVVNDLSEDSGRQGKYRLHIDRKIEDHDGAIESIQKCHASTKQEISEMRDSCRKCRISVDSSMNEIRESCIEAIVGRATVGETEGRG